MSITIPSSKVTGFGFGGGGHGGAHLGRGDPVPKFIGHLNSRVCLNSS